MRTAERKLRPCNAASVLTVDASAWSLGHMSACVHVTIHGRVQGVGYRSWTVKNAQKMGLTGWVKNRTNGTVEALFCGDEHAVEAMVLKCEQGPLAAKVTHLDRKMPDMPPPADFTQLATD